MKNIPRHIEIRIKKCEYCGREITLSELPIDQKAWVKRRFCSQICKIKGTKGEDWPKGKGQFKKGMTPWNKGKHKKNPIILRKIPERYLGELLDNAIRAKEKGYHKSPRHLARTEARQKEIVDLCGVHGSKPWLEPAISAYSPFCAVLKTE